MKIYHYSKDGLYIGQAEATLDPLEKGSYLIPAKATTEQPPIHKEGEEIYFTDKWNTRLRKTEQPSKYHTWNDKLGWRTTAAKQIELDADIVKAQEEKEKADLLSEKEGKIQAEIRLLAINSLKAKGEM